MNPARIQNQMKPGFPATATFHALPQMAPQTVPQLLSFAPTGGSGLSAVFTFTVSSPSGYTHVSEVQALFNSTLLGANGCYIRYDRPLAGLVLAAHRLAISPDGAGGQFAALAHTFNRRQRIAAHSEAIAGRIRVLDSGQILLVE